MNQARCNENDYINFLLATPRNYRCVAAAKVQPERSKMPILLAALGMKPNPRLSGLPLRLIWLSRFFRSLFPVHLRNFYYIQIEKRI